MSNLYWNGIPDQSNFKQQRRLPSNEADQKKLTFQKNNLRLSNQGINLLKSLDFKKIQDEKKKE